MIVMCGCGQRVATHAVYETSQPHCLLCMLDAVNTTIAIPVRTLDPWEMEKVEGPKQTKKAAH